MEIIKCNSTQWLVWICFLHCRFRNWESTLTIKQEKSGGGKLSPENGDHSLRPVSPNPFCRRSRSPAPSPKRTPKSPTQSLYLEAPNGAKWEKRWGMMSEVLLSRVFLGCWGCCGHLCNMFASSVLKYCNLDVLRCFLCWKDKSAHGF